MSRRKPKSGVAITTLEEANQALAEIAGIDLKLASNDATMNRVITKAKTRAETVAAPLREQREALGAALNVFAVTSKTAHFGKKKSLKLLHGVIGFRVSRKLITLKGFTWKKVLEAIQGMGVSLEDWAIFSGCVRTKPEVDKDAVKELSDADMARKAERKAEKSYRRAIAALFQGDDYITMFKRREIYRHLSNAADRMANCANTLHDIVVKIT